MSATATATVATPALAGSDRVPVSSVLYGRTFRVHVNDTDAMAWGSVDGGQVYNTYLRRQADSNYAHNRDSLDAYGSHWAGPYVPTNHSCQHSVLDLLNVAP